MKTRIISGLVAAVLAVTLFLAGPMWMLLLVALSAATVAYLEYDRLFFGPSRTRPVRLIALIVLTIVAMRVSATAAWLAFWLAISILLVSHVLTGNKRPNIPMEVRAVSMELMGYWYVVSLFGFLLPIAEISEHGRAYLLLLFTMVFWCDTGAYFVGKFWGRRKLASQLSPKKTVEGAIGGLFGSVLAVVAWMPIFVPEADAGYWIRLLVVAPVIGGLAQFGDLFESLLKRSQQQKDSGSFLPGHGGMLDRVDGLALTAPAFYFYLVYVLENFL